MVETSGATLCTGVPKRPLRHDHFALATDLLEDRFGHDRTHVNVVRLQEGGDADIVLADRCVHLDDGDALGDHLANRIDQGVDAKGLNRHKVPITGGHVINGFALGVNAQATVKPGHLNAHPLAPIFGGLFALGAPGSTEAGVRERSLEWLAKGIGMTRTLGRRRTGLLYRHGTAGQ